MQRFVIRFVIDVLLLRQLTLSPPTAETLPGASRDLVRSGARFANKLKQATPQAANVQERSRALETNPHLSFSHHIMSSPPKLLSMTMRPLLKLHDPRRARGAARSNQPF